MIIGSLGVDVMIVIVSWNVQLHGMAESDTECSTKPCLYVFVLEGITVHRIMGYAASEESREETKWRQHPIPVPKEWKQHPMRYNPCTLCPEKAKSPDVCTILEAQHTVLIGWRLWQAKALSREGNAQDQRYCRSEISNQLTMSSCYRNDANCDRRPEVER